MTKIETEAFEESLKDCGSDVEEKIVGGTLTRFKYTVVPDLDISIVLTAWLPAIISKDVTTRKDQFHDSFRETFRSQ